MATKGGAKPGERRGGRQKGTPNKLTKKFKDAIALVYDDIGGDKAFAAWARKNQTEFYRIAARIIPHEFVGAGEGGEHVVRVIHDAR
jgi:hypothetical protein